MSLAFNYCIRFYPYLPTQGHGPKFSSDFVLLSVFLFLLDNFHQQSCMLLFILSGKRNLSFCQTFFSSIDPSLPFALWKLLKNLHLFDSSSFWTFVKDWVLLLYLNCSNQSSMISPVLHSVVNTQSLAFITADQFWRFSDLLSTIYLETVSSLGSEAIIIWFYSWLIDNLF